MNAQNSPTTANHTADFYLSFCREHGDSLTNLRLQKILYYAQSWYLAFQNRPLFAAKFQAWVHGPVIPAVYRRFKDSGWQPIADPITRPQISSNISTHLTNVFEVYGRYSAWELERMTHAEEPWKVARRGLAPEQNSEEEISEKLMRDVCLNIIKASKNRQK